MKYGGYERVREETRELLFNGFKVLIREKIKRCLECVAFLVGVLDAVQLYKMVKIHFM